MADSNTGHEIRSPQSESDTPYVTPDELGERRICILEAAHDVLATEGYHRFTMRRIADRAKMHLKTLQHYYPTKRNLLLGTLQYTLSRYYEKYWRMLEKHDENPRETFRLVIQFLLDDLRNPRTSRFFPELWALSSRDPDATLAMDHLYSFYRKRVDQLVRAINPTLSRHKSTQRTFALVAMIEGMTLFIGQGKPEHKELDDIDEEIINAATQIVFAP
jgi:AcrR family transcriptional regulator